MGNLDLGVRGKCQTIEVAKLATGGRGDEARPWVGWETGVNALPPGTFIHFCGGWYRQKLPIFLKSGQSVSGDGWGTVIKHEVEGWGDMLAAIHVAPPDLADPDPEEVIKDVQIANLRIEGIGSWESQEYILNDKGIRIIHAEDIVVQKVWVDKVHSEAVYAQFPCARVKMLFNRVTNVGFNAYNHNGSCPGSIIQGNTAYRVGANGVELASDDVVITDNVIDTFRLWGIAVGQGAARDVIVKSNIITNGTAPNLGGLLLQQGARHTIITGNVIHHNAGSGITVQRGELLEGTEDTEYNLIADNVIHDNGPGSADAANIDIKCVTKLFVTGNFVYSTTGNQGFPGIKIQDETDRTVVIENNNVIGHQPCDIRRDSFDRAAFGRNYVTSGLSLGDLPDAPESDELG